MKTIPHRHHAVGKRKIRQRLDRPVTATSPKPVFTAANIHYDVAEKTRAIAPGGIGAIQLLVRKLGLAQAIDDRLHLLKYHLPGVTPRNGQNRTLRAWLIRTDG